MTTKNVEATSDERFEVKDIPPKLQVLSNYVIDQVLGESALEKLPKLEAELSSMREENLRLKADAIKAFNGKEAYESKLRADLLLTREVAEKLSGVLEFYADPDSYVPFVLSGSLIDKDLGEEARGALNEFKKGIK